jgi:hypothetical protein
MALGWLVVVASVALAVFTAVRLAAIAVMVTRADQAAITATALAIGGIGVGIGVILLTIGRSGRAGLRSGRLRLWAKLVVIVGLELCAGIPLLLYGMMFLGLSVMHDPTAPPLDPFQPDFLFVIGEFSAVPFLIGFVAIASACIWGRRKTTDIPDVFS